MNGKNLRGQEKSLCKRNSICFMLEFDIQIHCHHILVLYISGKANLIFSQSDLAIYDIANFLIFLSVQLQFKMNEDITEWIFRLHISQVFKFCIKDSVTIIYWKGFQWDVGTLNFKVWGNYCFICTSPVLLQVALCGRDGKVLNFILKLLSFFLPPILLLEDCSRTWLIWKLEFGKLYYEWFK